MLRKTKRKIRKPRELKINTPFYPRIENDAQGRIWVQASQKGKWVKIPPRRAEVISIRLQRAINYNHARTRDFA